MYIGANPIILLLLPTLLPIIYNFLKKRPLKPVLLIYLCCILVVLAYPLVDYLSKLHVLGYTIGKFLLFVLLPVLFVFYLERWNIKEIFGKLGVGKNNLRKSVLYGLIGSIIMISVTFLVSSSSQFDLVYSTIMFFESFNEEFFFRGFLLLYLMSKTDFKLTYLTSILAFVLIHPQHFDSIYILSAITQALLTTHITSKTKNILGPWFLHGLNRLVPGILKAII